MGEIISFKRENYYRVDFYGKFYFIVQCSSRDIEELKRKRKKFFKNDFSEYDMLKVAKYFLDKNAKYNIYIRNIASSAQREEYDCYIDDALMMAYPTGQILNTLDIPDEEVVPVLL